MIYDVFEKKYGISVPYDPGTYLGSIEIDQTIRDGIALDVARFDLHLRETKRKAYGEKYNLIPNEYRKPYKWRLNK